MDWLDYREKLGIGFSDPKRTQYFVTKMFNLLGPLQENHYSECIDVEEYYKFCNITGTNYNYNLAPDYQRSERMSACLNVLKYNSSNLADFLAYYIAFTNSVKVKKSEHNRQAWNRQSFINLLQNMLSESHIAFDVVHDGDEYFVFPKGAKELDDALVSEPLEWLKGYPKTNTAFVKVLKAYSEATENTASDVADLFRKALETFFQEFFGSTKTLENLKAEYGTYMKSKGVPAEISNNLETLQQAYTNYMNGYAKHQNKASINVLEYIMYQTGNIVRLLITISKEDK